MPDTIFMGGSVKALGGGRVAGYLVQYSTAATPDHSRERDFFTADTDFDLDTGNRKSVFYAHGLDAKMGVKRIGVGEVKQDETGVWIEAQLNMRDAYEQAIYGLAEQDKLGWSSGAPSHLVTRKAIETDHGTVHEIKTWPLAEASLTPCPADSRNSAIAFKSLPTLLGVRPSAENHTTKALPSGMSYNDLLALLTAELNEDFPDTDDPMGMDMGMPGLMICDVFDSAIVYCDCDEPGDLTRIGYTVDAGNDVQWGTPESVIRTTVYQTATDTDDTETGDMPQIKAFNTAIAPATMPFDAQLDAALAAVSGVIDRGFDISELRIKAGRTISGANMGKMKEVHTGMTVIHDALAQHIRRMGDLISGNDPAAKKDADEVAALRMAFLRRQSRNLGVAV